MVANRFQHEVLQRLRSLAMTYPDVVEGDSCVKRSFKARTKGFLYLGEKTDEYNVMLKLGPSVEEARNLASVHAGRWSVGKAGWTTLKFAPDELPPEGLLERWLDESFRIQAPKTLVRTLDA